MRLKTAGQRLVFIDRPWFLPALFFVGGCGLAFGLWRRWELGGQASPGAYLVLAGAAGLMFALAMALSDHSRFVFDAKLGQLRWRSESFWRRRYGTLALKDVYDIRLEMRQDESGKENCRAILETAQGPLPMSRHYRGCKQEWEAIINDIRAFAGGHFGQKRHMV